MVNITANLIGDKELKEELKKFGIGILPQVKFGLSQWLNKVVDVARTIVPVKTGRLQSSLNFEVNDKGASLEGVFGTNVFYGKYVELGTRRMRARPYLIPALEQTLDELVDFIKKAIG